MENAGPKIGDRFQQETKYTRPSYLSKGSKKTSESFLSRTIPLPSPSLESGPSLWKVLEKRRSVRDYRPTPLTLAELSTLLWATQGITQQAFSAWYRTSPSAGALHPIDTYLVINRVEGLDPGTYFLKVPEFSLAARKIGDFSSSVARAALDQEMARAAAVVFVWVAVIERSRQKYRQRAYRYIYLDCGHIGQNLYLAASAMGLGCCAVGAFFDDEVNELVGVDGQEETAIYLAAVGKK
jgi:SagB-type dehydrogenase family enzyme